MVLYWMTVFVVAFAWTFGIGLQTKAVARSHIATAAATGIFLCGVQIFIVRAAVYENPWLFFVVGGIAYALGNVASISIFDRVARSRRNTAPGAIGVEGCSPDASRDGRAGWRPGQQMSGDRFRGASAGLRR